MKVHIIDDRALTSVSPRDIRSYLQLHGWTRAERGGGGPDVWSLHADFGDYEVIAPSSREARDFSKRAAELIRTVAIAEERSELDVLRDVSTLSFDIQYFLTESASRPGTTLLRDAAEAFGAANSLLAATTATLEEPRLVLPSRRSVQTLEFMKKVLAGPTSEGSYVISVWVPVPPRLTQEEDAVLFDDPNEPFERKATRQLNRALTAARSSVRDVLEGDNGLDAFIARKDDGISANLCEALVAFAGEDERGFEVNFAWALDRPATNVTRSISFDADAIPVLREAAREIRAQVPEEQVRIRGSVVRLHRETQLGAGDVTIAGVVTGDPGEKLRRVQVNLSEADYQRAITAHEHFSDVEIVGSLVLRGTRTYLTEPGNLDVREPPEG